MNAIQPVRVFVALPLSEGLRAELHLCQQYLARHFNSQAIKWVRPEQIHLTLRFMGNVLPQQVPEIIEALKGACHLTAACSLRADKLGCFPNRQRPRVLWIGLVGELEPLRHLQREIGRATEPWGDNRETRDFEPHLTLGRIKEGQRIQIDDALANSLPQPSSTWQVDHAELIQSNLTPQGPIYQTLTRLHL